MNDEDAHTNAENADLAAGYERVHDSPEWVVTRPAGGVRPGLSFQREQYHAAPTWPGGPTDLLADYRR